MVNHEDSRDLSPPDQDRAPYPPGPSPREDHAAGLSTQEQPSAAKQLPAHG